MKHLSITISLPITEHNFIIFCQQLLKQDKMFHFEDSPFEIVSSDGSRIFGDKEASLIESYLTIAFDTLNDPMEIALECLTSHQIMNCED